MIVNNLFNRLVEALPQPNNSKDEGKGYGCGVYQDHLILLGTTREIRQSRGGGSFICAYNLKEQRAEEIAREIFHVPIGSCTPFLYHNLPNGIIFYGKVEDEAGRGMGMGTGGTNSSNSRGCAGVIFRIQKLEGDRLDIQPEASMTGLGSAFSVSYPSEEFLYVYDPNSNNANFGSLEMYGLDSALNGWYDCQANRGDLRLSEPSRHAIFVKDILYIFAGNVDIPGQTIEAGYSNLEDIYTLDLKKRNKIWERISPSGQTPGLMTNVSLAEANGMIYVFGLIEGKSILWVYNIREQVWKQVRDINTLTARPDQKAVIYEGKLLIVDWGYSKDSVQIQYFSLNNLVFAVPSVGGNIMCRDEAENFFADAKNLYNTKIFSDVTFEIEGEEILAHKATLASRSNYFMKMFTSGMSESHSAKISIPNMKSHIFKAMLQYIYRNEVELNEKLALDLIPTVDEFVMKGLKGLCEKYLCKKLRKDNVVDILIIADRHEIDELKKACFKFILTNLDNIDENEEINRLSKSLLIELLKLCSSEKKDKPSENSQKQYAFPPPTNNNMNNNQWNNNNVNNNQWNNNNRNNNQWNNNNLNNNQWNNNNRNNNQWNNNNLNNNQWNNNNLNNNQWNNNTNQNMNRMNI